MQLSIFVTRKQNFSMQKVKNIILDYGNVIFMIDFQRLKRAFLELGIPNVDEVFGHSGQIRLFDEFDKGKISSTEFREGLRALANRPLLSDEEVDAAWNALLIGVPAGKHELLTRLNDKYRTFLLSNNNEIHYAYCMEHIRQEYGVQDNSGFFEKTYYSHLMGMRKPDKEIFLQVLAENNLIPEETLFIDDSPQHLATAEELGMQVELCTSERPLEQIVRAYNLL